MTCPISLTQSFPFLTYNIVDTTHSTVVTIQHTHILMACINECI